MTERILATASGKLLDLAQPSPAAIDVTDIALALSRICRFGGLSNRFYSVAQHAVLVSNIVSEDLARPDLAFDALHHDSHEAYVGDLPRPVRALLRDGGESNYDDLCSALNAAIARALGCNPFQPQTPDGAVIAQADDLALIAEASLLLPGGVDHIQTWLTADQLSPPRDTRAGDLLDAEQSRLAFLDAHHALAPAGPSPQDRASDVN